MKRLGNTPYFLKRLLEWVLSLHRLKFGDQDGRTNETVFERSGSAIQIIALPGGRNGNEALLYVGHLVDQSGNR